MCSITTICNKHYHTKKQDRSLNRGHTNRVLFGMEQVVDASLNRYGSNEDIIKKAAITLAQTKPSPIIPKSQRKFQVSSVIDRKLKTSVEWKEKLPEYNIDQN